MNIIIRKNLNSGQFHGLCMDWSLSSNPMYITDFFIFY